VICDEAHKTAGWQSGTFATVLDERKIRARRRLFMTATPRIYGRKIQNDAEGDFRVHSMDDEQVYGPVAYSMSFATAIKNRPAPLLCDYRVVAISVSDTEARQAIKDRLLIRLDERLADAETVASHVAVGKAIRRFRLKKLISFHSRVAAAQTFAGDASDGFASTLKRARLRPHDLWTAHVAGDMSAGERDSLLHQFGRATGVALLANARCLTEGIDVPSTDSVVFIDPRQSKIDIVQAIGRAIRLSPKKRVGTIVVPVVIGPTRTQTKCWRVPGSRRSRTCFVRFAPMTSGLAKLSTPTASRSENDEVHGVKSADSSTRISSSICPPGSRRRDSSSR
jgi:predicted helicase